MALTRGAMGLSAVCDCGISGHTHLLFLNKQLTTKNVQLLSLNMVHIEMADLCFLGNTLYIIYRCPKSI